MGDSCPSNYRRSGEYCIPKAGSESTSNGYHGYGGGSTSSYLTVDAGRAIAGSIVLEGDACACDFDDLKNRSRNAIAVGNATAGSIHINTMATVK